MSRENRLWGAPRIHGELLKLGIDISETSVGKYMKRHHRPPSQTWRTFLDNHLATMVSVDFFTVATIRFQVLYVFLILAHDRRRILHVGVTAHPTAEWTAQQLREAFPWETAPRYLLRDRDAIFGHAFEDQVTAMGMSEVLSTPGSPWQRAYIERVIGRRPGTDDQIRAAWARAPSWPTSASPANARAPWAARAVRRSARGPIRPRPTPARDDG
jgi:putative transposase